MNFQVKRNRQQLRFQHLFFSDVRVEISVEYGDLLLPETQFEYTQPF